MILLDKSNKLEHWQIQNKWQILYLQTLAAAKPHFLLPSVIILDLQSHLPVTSHWCHSLSPGLRSCSQMCSFVHQTPPESLSGAKAWAGLGAGCQGCCVSSGSHSLVKMQLGKGPHHLGLQAFDGDPHGTQAWPRGGGISCPYRRRLGLRRSQKGFQVVYDSV